MKNLPGVSSIVTWLSQAPLPKADPQRFAVALAHLEYNDKEQQHELLIREALKDFKGVQLLLFDRTISLEGTQPEESEKKGHARARQYLEDSKAHVLIWGLIQRHDDKSAPRLYWTTLQDTKRAIVPYQPENFKLPELFWNDLAEVLRLVVATQYSKFQAQAGHFIVDQLTPFIERVRRLIDKSAEGQGWSKVQVVLGDALSTLGEETGKNKPLEEAVAAYHAALTELTPERAPLDWAMAQNNLGTALGALGERERGTTHLEKAVKAYQDALSVWTRERAPLDWAMAQGNLGAVLTALGEREVGATRLKEAVAAFHNALKEQKRMPLRWAITQTNLGNALFRLGEREGGTTRLEEAVAAHRAALTKLTWERVPLAWAAAQINLGNALAALGKREASTTRLEEAMKAYQDALSVWTRERAPLDWAMAQTSLGVALATLGMRKKDATLLCGALEKQLMAWEVSAIGSPAIATMAANNAKYIIRACREIDVDLTT